MTPAKSKSDHPERLVSEPSHFVSRARRARASALWAAYADAVGWISELTDARGLARRSGSPGPLRGPVAWRRKIGGKTGPTVDLAAGTYSDDTQLRLAVGRAIGSNGFDVEAFAAVELPVWPAYALGGGHSSKAAAAHLAKPTPWFANFYEGWANAGGNGVAMRVQPHVWAAPDLDVPDSFLVPLIRDAVSTHGHPVALAGAAIHASVLAATMSTGELPNPTTLAASVEALEHVPDLIRGDPELGELWLPAWERQTRRRYPDAWAAVLEELSVAIQAAVAAGAEDSGSQGYREILATLELYEPSRRGSGVLTAIAAAALTWCHRDPADGVADAANALDSDTDTIGTMAGALYGAAAAIDPPGPVLDAELIAHEAERLTAIAQGEDRRGHQYPDLLRWSPPRTQADALVTDGEDLHVLGLGPVVEELGEPIMSGSFQWRRVRLAVGQTLIVKGRQTLRRIPRAADAERHDGSGDGTHDPRRGHAMAFDVADLGSREAVDQLFDVSAGVDASTKSRGRRPLDRGIELDRVFQYLEDHSYDDAALAYSLRRIACDGTRDQMVALVVAIRDRLRRDA